MTDRVDRVVRLGDRIRARSVDAFVGRSRELDLLRTWMSSAEPPAVVLIHGPPGIGKSALIDAFAATLAPGDGIIVACHEVEPTPGAVLTHLGAELRTTPELDAIATALAGRPRALFLDAAERLHLLDSWLREELLPSLPEAVTTVLVRRLRPSASWFTAPGWQGLVAELGLGPLDGRDARALVSGHGLDESDIEAICRFARGHPLALRLAAELAPVVDRTPPPEALRLIEELVDRLLDGLPSADIRLVQAASTLRRVTESDLAQLLEDDGPPGGVHDWWSRLRTMSFTSLTADGLEIHDVVRTAVQSSLTTRDPERAAALRRRAVRIVRSRARSSTPTWSHTADLLHLVRDPIVRDGFFPPDAAPMPVDPARPEDLPAVERIVGSADGPQAAHWIGRWINAHPGSLRVVRDRGAVVAFQTAVRWSEVDPWLVRDDPLGAVWVRHLERSPLQRGEEALLVRRTLGEHGEQPAPALASLFVDVKRTYLELRPHLRRVYLACGPSPALTEMFRRLGFVDLGTPVELDGRSYQARLLDFGPESVDGWLAGLLDDEPSPPDVTTAAPTPIDALTPREREVLALVTEGHTNKAVAAELGISAKTVGRHLESVFTKLGVTTRAAAASIATAHGLTR